MHNGFFIAGRALSGACRQWFQVAILTAAAVAGCRANLISIGFLSLDSDSPISGQNTITVNNFTGATFGCGNIDPIWPICQPAQIQGILQVDWRDQFGALSFDNFAVIADPGQTPVVTYDGILTLVRADLIATIAGDWVPESGLNVDVLGGFVSDAFPLGDLQVSAATATVPEPSLLFPTAMMAGLFCWRRRWLLRAAPLAVLMLGATAGRAASTVNVTLSPVASPSTAVEGSTVYLTAGGLPSTVLPSQLRISLSPGPNCPPTATTASAITPLAGTASRIAFIIPPIHVLLSPVDCLISVRATVPEPRINFTVSPKIRLLPQPTVDVSPLTIPAGSSGYFAMVGSWTHFLQGSTRIQSSLPELTVDQVLVFSSTSLQAHYTVAEVFSNQSATLTVTTSSEAVTTTQNIQISGAPYVSSISPANQGQGATFGLTIAGSNTHFSNASAVDLGAGITFGAVSAISSRTLNVQVTIAPTAALGARTVKVTTGTEVATRVNAFQVQLPTPQLTGVSPTQIQAGAPVQSIAVSGRFTHFNGGGPAKRCIGVFNQVNTTLTWVYFVNNGVTLPALCVTVVSEIKLSAEWGTAFNAPLNSVDVKVTTPGEVVTLQNAITITDPCQGKTAIQATVAAEAVLAVNGCITGLNENGNHAFLTVQSDCNLVLYGGTPQNPGAATWATQTAGRTGPCALHVQNDGNLVLKDANSSVIWSSDSFDNGPPYDYYLTLNRLNNRAELEVELFRGVGPVRREEEIWSSDATYYPGQSLGSRIVTGQQERTIYTVARLIQILEDRSHWPSPIIGSEIYNDVSGLLSGHTNLVAGDIKDAYTKPAQANIEVETGETMAIVFRGTTGEDNGFDKGLFFPCAMGQDPKFCTSASWAVNNDFLGLTTNPGFTDAVITTHEGWAIAANDMLKTLKDSISNARNIHPGVRVVIAGHSQGGAIAGYMVYRLLSEGGWLNGNDMLVTFGAPYYAGAVCNQTLIPDRFNSHFRDLIQSSGFFHYPVTNANDPNLYDWDKSKHTITNICVDPPYTQDGRFVNYPDSLAPGDPHAISTYVKNAAYQLLNKRRYYLDPNKGPLCDVTQSSCDHSAYVKPLGFLPRNFY